MATKNTKKEQPKDEKTYNVRYKTSELESMKVETKDKTPKEVRDAVREKHGLKPIRKQTKLQKLREKYDLPQKSTYRDIVEHIENKG